MHGLILAYIEYYILNDKVYNVNNRNYKNVIKKFNSTKI